MTEREIAAFVDASCAAQGLALPDDVRARVIAQFARIAAIAAPVCEAALERDVDPANTFRP